MNLKKQLALHGYDPVSYFYNKPVPGISEIRSKYKQMEFQFSTKQNKKQFDSEPERYVPMYGGYCAYGVSMGKKLDIDPLAYEINNDRLYVLLNRATHKLWTKNMQENIKISDRLWPQIKNKSTADLK